MENQVLQVTLVQFSPEWENKQANLDYCNSLLHGINGSDLIVLPEMFTTGFSMQVAKLAEPMEGDSVGWMMETSRRLNAAIAGSLIILDHGRYYNRLIWVTPGGEVQWYDKRHLFSMGEEHLHFTPGNRRITFTWRHWRIRPLVCYDLRFPVWSRNHDDYDLLLYVANWPSARHHVWKNLLMARALENQSWCVAVNRTGADGMKLNYLGDSGVISPKGIAHWQGAGELVQTFSLSKLEVEEFRAKFPVLRDRDEFEIP